MHLWPLDVKNPRGPTGLTPNDQDAFVAAMQDTLRGSVLEASVLKLYGADMAMLQSYHREKMPRVVAWERKRTKMYRCPPSLTRISFDKVYGVRQKAIPEAPIPLGCLQWPSWQANQWILHMVDSRWDWRSMVLVAEGLCPAYS
jgi:hypothetical protein